jgi:hypothetical protein
VPIPAFPNNQPHPATQTNEEIQLFSVRTGKKLRSVIAVTGNSPNPISCIRFSRGVRSELNCGSELRARENEPPSLMASQLGTIWECELDGQGSDSEEDEE